MESNDSRGSLYKVGPYLLSINIGHFSPIFRIACWAFLADGFLTVCFNNHPALSIFEMNCQFPWSSALFEAENASSFNEIAASYTAGRPLPSLREFITRLLDDNATEDLIQWSRSLVGEHLLILIYGLYNRPHATQSS